MWLYKPKDVVTMWNFFSTNLDGMWMMVFKPSKNEFPPKAEDCDLDIENGPTEVKIVLLMFIFTVFRVSYSE